MDFQNLNELYKKLKHKQISLTTNFLHENIGNHRTLLDISNKYLFEKCILTLKKLIKNTYNTSIPLKSLILQNCMLSSSSANNLLSIFLSFQGRLNLSYIDLSNNSLTLTPQLSQTIVKVLEKSGKNEHKKLILQGNVISNPEAFSILLSSSFSYSRLSLYDSFLQPSTLMQLSESLSSNKIIQKLDLSYNSSGFTSKTAIYSLGVSLGLNQHLTVLKLSGNASLSNKSLLSKLCIGLKHTRSLEKLFIGNIPLQDTGIKILRKKLLKNSQIETIDLQNNKITNLGISKLIENIPENLIHVNLSYNEITDSKVLEDLGRAFISQRSLRVLNLSYCFDFGEISPRSMNMFCKGITENRSLNELNLEGCKIYSNPDYFCRDLGEAIEARRYPITFRISAIKNLDSKAPSYLSKTQERILQDLTE